MRQVLFLSNNRRIGKIETIKLKTETILVKTETISVKNETISSKTETIISRAKKIRIKRGFNSMMENIFREKMI